MSFINASKAGYIYSLTVCGHFFPFVHHLLCSLSDGRRKGLVEVKL